MKANTGQYDEPKSAEEAIENHLKEYDIKMEKASLNSFILGGHTALKLAYDRFSKEMRTGTQKERLAAGEELLEYLQNRSKGLKGVAEKE